ncbi:MAG: serine/threonine protein kinase [Roseiflexaceae bacterium]
MLLGVLPLGDRAQREDVELLARQVAALRHDLLLPVRDQFAEASAFYLVCPDPGGQDLERQLRAPAGPRPEAEVLAQARRLVDLLEYLHAQRPPLFLGELWLADLWVADNGAWRLVPLTLMRAIATEPAPYLAPELAQPAAEPNPATDTYAVCALLYHLLTGWPPPSGAQLQSGTRLPAPRTLNPELSALTEQALLRGLDRKTVNRYQNARELRLALDTLQMMGGRSLGLGPDVVAREPAPVAAEAEPMPVPPPAPPKQRGVSTGCLVSLGTLMVVLLFGVCLGLMLAVPRTLQMVSLVSQRQNGSAPTPQPAATGQTAAPQPTGELGPNAISAENAGTITRTLTITSVVAGPIQFSPDGETLAIGVSNSISLRSADLNREIRSIEGEGGTVFALAFSPDGTLLASSAVDENQVRLWEVSSGRLVRTFSGHSGWVRSLRFSPDGSVLASGSTDRSIRLWDVASGRSLRTLSGHTNWLGGLDFSPDGTLLASASRDGTVRLWDVANGRERNGFALTLPDQPGTSDPVWATSVVFSPDGAQLAVGSIDTAVRLVSVASGEVERELSGHTDWIFIGGLAYAPDGRMLLSASLDGSVRAWDPASGVELGRYDDRALRISGMAVSPDGQRLATTSGEEGEVALWDMAARRQLDSLRIGMGLVLGLTYSDTGALLSTSGFNGTMQFYEFSRKRLVTRPGAAPRRQAVAFLPGSRPLIVTDQNTVLLYGADGETKQLAGLDGVPLNVTVSLDTKTIAANDDQGTIAVWTPGSTEPERTFESKLQAVLVLAVSQDGRLIAAGGTPGDSRIEIWERATGKLLHTLQGPNQGISWIAFQPGGKLVVAIDGQGRLRTWDADSGEMQREINPTSEQVRLTYGGFSPDGSLLAAGTLNGTIAFYDPASGRQITSVGAGGIPVALAFSPDGAQIAISLRNQDLPVYVYELPKR